MVSLNVMLAIEQVHGAEKVDIRAKWALPTGCAVLVLHDDRRLVANRPTRLARTQAPIQIITIHKEALIQQANPLNDLAAHKHARAAHGIHLDGQVGIDEREVVAPEARAVAEEAAKAGQPMKGNGRGRRS